MSEGRKQLWGDRLFSLRVYLNVGKDRLENGASLHWSDDVVENFQITCWVTFGPLHVEFSGPEWR